MPKHDTTHTIILAAIDYSDASTRVVERAALLAQQSRPCHLHFLHVNQFTSGDAADTEGGKLELLEWLAPRLPREDKALTDINVIAHDLSGDPENVIVELATVLLAECVIVGTHGRQGLERIVWGSVAEAVSRRCSYSVLVVRGAAQEAPTFASEPVCGVCVEARIQSRGNVSWCHDHAPRRDRHARATRAGRWLRASIATSPHR